MKITGCRFFHVEAPRETGAISEHVMIRVDTSEGISGWGELSDMHHQHPALVPSMALLEEEANYRIDGADPYQIRNTLDRLGDVIPEAFDLALHDLLGKILDVPVYVLLGGKRRDRIPFCYPIFPMSTPAGEDHAGEVETQIKRVQRIREMGQKRIRKYIGANLKAEEAFLEAFRDAFGDAVEIKSLDLSGRFHWQEALALLQRFKRFNYQVAESVSKRFAGPHRAWERDIAGMAEVRKQLGMPISEHLNSVRMLLDYHNAGAVDVANIATCATGIAKTKFLFEFASELGLRTLHGTTQELSIGTAAAAHVMASLATVDMPCDPAGPLLYMDDCTQNRVQYEDSCLIVPQGPGLGVEVDEQHLVEIASKGNRLKQMRKR